MDAGTEDIKTIWLNSDVLSNFIDELREAGYRIGVSQYIAVQDLVLALTAQGVSLDNPERLRTLLGPILCSSPSEQEDFQYRFDHWIELLRHSDGAVENIDIKAKALSEELGKVRWHFRQLVLIITIIFPVFFLPIFLETINRDDQSNSPSPTAPSPTAPSPTAPSPTAPSPTTITVRKNPDLLRDWQTAIGVSLLAICTTFLILRFWWLWRAQLFLQRHSTTQQPELHRISIDAFEQNLFPPILFIQIAQNLRKRIPVSSHELDIYKTIDATLRQGGWLTPVYGFRQLLPEYLFLIDRTSYRDHQAKFVEEIIGRLSQNGVFITTYYFDDDPRVCFPSDGISPPQKLHEIAVRYPQHRLVIVSDAEKLFDASTSEVEAWVSQTVPWSHRAILTPKPVETWGYQELALAQEFVVLPATPKGVQALGQVFYQGTAIFTLSEGNLVPLPEPLRVRPYRWIERDPPLSEQIDIVLEALQRYLGKDGFYWLSACAVFPELHWNITIYLGSILKTERGHSLLEACSVIDLARLPWFRYGYMPDWLREHLIKTLTQKQDKAIRTALQDLLVTAIQGSVGKLQLEVARQHHRFLARLANPILRLLSQRAPEDSWLRDYMFLSFMSERPKLAIKMSSKFSRLLYKQKKLRTLKQRFWSRLQLAIWLIIPALIAVGVVEHNLREASVKADYARLDQEGTYGEKQAVEALVQGCYTQQQMGWLLSYLAERLFGNCRSLYRAPLAKADLSYANLRAADLSNANLSNADLRAADLRNADLRNANLRNANLSNASLSNANLSNANLSNASLSNANLSNADLSYAHFGAANLSNTNFSNSILLAANMEGTNLQNAQLSGDKPPILCNVLLPSTTSVDPNRDCDRLSQVVHSEFPRDTCGDRSTATPTATWYPVFIDEGNLEEIRRKYCADAIAIQNRGKTGKPSVLVASFTDRSRAEAFAQAVGGEVDEPRQLEQTANP
jgi:hypothetical protein